ncbi:hypothetical protein GE09DRAFT_621958 [Coniochaeta sp. 2T2.1]|nr:hypothetical protein GE09DRAFT_621958 [Coniochaeta sp. 2T2.1]
MMDEPDWAWPPPPDDINNNQVDGAAAARLNRPFVQPYAWPWAFPGHRPIPEIPNFEPLAFRYHPQILPYNDLPRRQVRSRPDLVHLVSDIPPRNNNAIPELPNFRPPLFPRDPAHGPPDNVPQARRSIFGPYPEAQAPPNTPNNNPQAPGSLFGPPPQAPRRQNRRSQGNNAGLDGINEADPRSDGQGPAPLELQDDLPPAPQHRNSPVYRAALRELHNAQLALRVINLREQEERQNALLSQDPARPAAEPPSPLPLRVHPQFGGLRLPAPTFLPPPPVRRRRREHPVRRVRSADDAPAVAADAVENGEDAGPAARVRRRNPPRKVKRSGSE